MLNIALDSETPGAPVVARGGGGDVRGFFRPFSSKSLKTHESLPLTALKRRLKALKGRLKAANRPLTAAKGRQGKQTGARAGRFHQSRLGELLPSGFGAAFALCGAQQ